MAQKYRPYVYKRADELGIPMQDGKNHVKIVVTDDDIVRAKKANSKHCALARAALRLPEVNAAYFFRSVAFIEYPDRMVKYVLPMSVQKEIVSFDRARVFAPGVYQLSPIPASLSRPALDKRNKQDKRERKQRRVAEKRAATSALQVTPPDLTSARGFEAAVVGVIDKHAGGRSVTGIRRPDAPEPLPGRAPSRYVHRTQYVRDLREPAG